MPMNGGLGKEEEREALREELNKEPIISDDFESGVLKGINDGNGGTVQLKNTENVIQGSQCCEILSDATNDQKVEFAIENGWMHFDSLLYHTAWFALPVNSVLTFSCLLLGFELHNRELGYKDLYLLEWFPDTEVLYCWTSDNTGVKSRYSPAEATLYLRQLGTYRLANFRPVAGGPAPATARIWHRLSLLVDQPNRKYKFAEIDGYRFSSIADTTPFQFGVPPFGSFLKTLCAMRNLSAGAVATSILYDDYKYYIPNGIKAIWK